MIKNIAGSGEVRETDVLDHLLLPEVWQNPYPFYSSLRHQRVVRHVGSLPGLVFTRHADVSKLLRDHRLSNQFHLQYSRARVLSPDEEHVHSRVLSFLSGGWMQADEQFHSSVRDHLSPIFSPTRIAGIECRIRETYLRLLEMVSPSSVDFMGELARPLINDVLGVVFGVPSDVCAQVHRFSSTIATFLCTTGPTQDEVEAVDRELHTLTHVLIPIIEERRCRPRDDVITALACQIGPELSLEDVALQCSLTLGAGLETTAGLLGNSLLAFLRHPESFRKMRQNPALLGDAIDECLRYDSPSQWVPRLARESISFNGISVRENELVWLGLGAANRDPEQFAGADVFRIARKPKALLSFGGGVHYCLGAHLARLEANIALATLFQHVEHLELSAERVTYKSNFGIRSPQSLRIQFLRSH